MQDRPAGSPTDTNTTMPSVTPQVEPVLPTGLPTIEENSEMGAGMNKTETSETVAQMQDRLKVTQEADKAITETATEATGMQEDSPTTADAEIGLPTPSASLTEPQLPELPTVDTGMQGGVTSDNVTNQTQTNDDDNGLPKKKPGFGTAMMAIGAILLVAGIGAASYFTAGVLQERVSVAPNTPTSEPLAFETDRAFVDDGSGVEYDATWRYDGTIDCTGIPNTAAFGNRCVATVTLESGTVVWAPGVMESLNVIDCSNIPGTAAYGAWCLEAQTLESGEIVWSDAARKTIDAMEGR
jgi:hypothetical protein